MMYICNNGNGWAVFKKNPGHHRDFAWCKNYGWSLSVADYFRTRKEAEDLLTQLKGK